MKKIHEELATVFAAFADRTRLRLLNLMTEGDVCVEDFVNILGDPQPKISRHLAFLRRAALVTARREGKWIRYSIVAPKHPTSRLVLQRMLEALRDDAEMTRDRTALARVRSPRTVGEKVQRTSEAEADESTIFFF